VRPTSANRKHRACVRLVKLRGTISQAGAAGANTLAWRGKVAGHKIGAGSYWLIATPSGGEARRVAIKILG